MKEKNKNWIWLIITVVSGSSIGIVLGVLREVLGRVG